MGDLSRRDNDRMPVQARRMGGPRPSMPPIEPIVIEVKPGQPIPEPVPHPGVTQNIVYVVAPPPAAPPIPPQAPPAQPQQVHYHTTHLTNNHYAPVKRRRQLGMSFVGRLAIVAGLFACLCCYVTAGLDYVKPLAEAGLALGGFGLVLAILFQRVGRGVPLIGMLISAIAFPIWLTKTGKLQSQYDQLRTKVPVLPAHDFSDISPGSTPPPAAPPYNVKPPTAAPHPIDHSIFGDSGWQKPDDTSKAPNASKP